MKPKVYIFHRTKIEKFSFSPHFILENEILLHMVYFLIFSYYVNIYDNFTTTIVLYQTKVNEPP